jgi:hypothetical protein
MSVCFVNFRIMVILPPESWERYGKIVSNYRLLIWNGLSLILSLSYTQIYECAHKSSLKGQIYRIAHGTIKPSAIRQNSTQDDI